MSVRRRGHAEVARRMTATEQLNMFREPSDVACESPFVAQEIIESAAVWFRQEGFPVPRPCPHAIMQAINTLAQTPTYKLASTTAGYRELDGYFSHRFGVPCQRRKTPRTTPKEAFESDTLLRVCLAKAIQCSKKIPAGYFPELGWTNGIQLAANFRPGFALGIYRAFCPVGGSIFDPCAGFGGRAIAAIAHSKNTRYFAFDASRKTVAAHTAMMNDIGRDGVVNVVHAAAEDVSHDAVRGKFDMSFTCPPYFKKEHYSEDPEQASVRYDSFDSFVSGFLRPMIALQAAAVRPGGVVGIVVDDVKVAYKEHSLVAATREACLGCGLAHEQDIAYKLTKRPGAGHDSVSSEVCMVFRAPNSK